jgi:hypothetical protein
MFVVEDGKAPRIVNLRKSAPLVWTRVEADRDRAPRPSLTAAAHCSTV